MRRSLLPTLIVVALTPLAACDSPSSDVASTSTSKTTSAAVPTIADAPVSSSTSISSSSSSTITTSPPALTTAQSQAIQDVLGEMGEGSMSGMLERGGQDGMGAASLAPGTHTVRATCGYGTGTLVVTIIPDLDKKTRYQRTVTCGGKDFLATRDVYRGWLGPNQQLMVVHPESGTVAFGVGITTH